MTPRKKENSILKTPFLIKNFDCIVKIKSILAIVFLLGFLIGSNACQQAGEIHLQQCFAPSDNCIQLINDTIGKAKKEISVQAYMFTSRPIANALIQAQQQGVAVTLLVDKSKKDDKNTQLYYMMSHNIPIYIDKVAGIAHNKVMIIDDTYVITDSFNWTYAAANKNAENILVIYNKNNNSIYRAAFQERMAKAVKLDRKDRRKYSL